MIAYVCVLVAFLHIGFAYASTTSQNKCGAVNKSVFLCIFCHLSNHRRRQNRQRSEAKCVMHTATTTPTVLALAACRVSACMRANSFLYVRYTKSNHLRNSIAPQYRRSMAHRDQYRSPFCIPDQKLSARTQQATKPCREARRIRCVWIQKERMISRTVYFRQHSQHL